MLGKSRRGAIHLAELAIENQPPNPSATRAKGPDDQNHGKGYVDGARHGQPDGPWTVSEFA